MPGYRSLRNQVAAATVAGLLSLLAPAARPAVASDRVDFARDVQPILQVRCLDCHGPAKQKGDFRLDSRAALLKGGSSGPAVVPGKASESRLVRLVAGDDPDAVMPPKGERLSAAQVATLRVWVDQGASWSAAGLATTQPADKTDHWAFRPATRPAVPTVNDPSLAGRLRTPIDAFVADRLGRAKLAFNPDASRPALLRRLTFDLTGLPPTPAEVDAFVADSSPDAYETVVDRLLASTAYGERWGRHWLDVVRYADTHGFEMNQPRPNAWRYRDWVIQSLIDDKPYDRFVMEQVAGDALAADDVAGAGGTVGADAATGFLVAGPWDEVKSPDPVLTAQQRADELHDMVATTGSAFLGLTVGCARCHDHKFDPVSQRDYFGLVACLAGVRHGERPMNVPPDPTRAEKVATLSRELAALDAELARYEPIARPRGASPADGSPPRPPVSARRNVDRFEPVEARFVRFEVSQTNDGAEPCVDELEVSTAGPEPTNVAAAARGAAATASGTYPNSALHRLEHVNDGRYGNARSWISDTGGRGWVQIAFDRPYTIDRVEWSRDRSPDQRYGDRLATEYAIKVSVDGKAWREVASSADRAPWSKSAADSAVAADNAVAAGDAARRAAALGLSASDLATRKAKLDARAGKAKALAELTKPAMAYAGTFVAPEPTRLLRRGEVTQPREVVDAAGPASIGRPLTIDPAAPERRRRLALARWLADPANPLTARVIVNRLWHYHFGRGLVATPSDFGHMGAKPTHPELLDWLAAELVANGWHLKPIHRLIVLSTAFRQSTATTDAGLAADADATLLWRYPPRRLEAEAIRDAMLAVAGTLDRTPGGPGFSLFEPTSAYVRIYVPKETFGPAEFRRMVYQQKPRTQQDGVFGAFDCPDAAQIAPTRTVSTTPLQALNLLNSPFAVQVSEAWAARLTKEAGDDAAAQVSLAFRLAFGRPPTKREAATSAAFVREHGLALLCRALLNANEFVFLD